MTNSGKRTKSVISKQVKTQGVKKSTYIAVLKTGTCQPGLGLLQPRLGLLDAMCNPETRQGSRSVRLIGSAGRGVGRGRASNPLGSVLLDRGGKGSDSGASRRRLRAGCEKLVQIELAEPDQEPG